MMLFKSYIKDIAKKPLISREREYELANKILAGNKKALDELVQANLKLVVKISLEYYKGSVSIMDIIQNGNMGLLQAARKYEADRGVKFSTYAAFWIKQSILRGFIKPGSQLNISYRKNNINKLIKRYINQYLNQHGKYPNLEEIQESLHVSRRDAVDVMLFYYHKDYSLNQAVFESKDEMINMVRDDNQNPEEIIEQNSMNDEVHEAIDSLSDRDRDIIKKRYGFDSDKKVTLKHLGQKYSISAEAARQIERRVLLYIKNNFPQLSYYFFSY